MSKFFDPSSVVESVQKLYAKDKKSKDMISTGDKVKQQYTEADGVPLDPSHPFSHLIGLPCLPYGKIVQWAGNEDTGKSTMSGLAMAAAQKSGHLVVLWDSEQKFDAHRYDKHFGGQSKYLALIQTNEILQGGEKVRKLVTAAKEKNPDLKILVVWDSIGGSQSRTHAERELDNEKSAQPGQDAKETGAVVKTLVALFNKYSNSIAVLACNQVYDKIGFMQVGTKESGGRKIAYHSSAIIQLKKIKTLTGMSKGVKIKKGIITRATVSKNHLSQGETSVHQMDFEITAEGVNTVGFSETESDEE